MAETADHVSSDRILNRVGHCQSRKERHQCTGDDGPRISESCQLAEKQTGEGKKETVKQGGKIPGRGDPAERKVQLPDQEPENKGNQEIRYRTETRTDTWTDEDGNTHTDTYEVEVPYTYYIMTVTLKNNGILHVAESTLDTEQLEMYHAYRDTSGNMPLLFGGGSFDTSPSTDLSGVEFVNGTRPGNKAIIELAKAQVGNVGG